MIPTAQITHWRRHAPWVQDVQVEQDLIISRALVELFSNSQLSEELAFRGGTALHKLHLEPARYSEDIDLVQVNQEPIGETIDAVRDALSPWLGESERYETKRARFTLYYQVESEPTGAPPIRLKVEINTREHFTVGGFDFQPFEVDSPWFSGEAEIRTYELEELLGTKLRALYQRDKGRDLFDLWYAYKQTNPAADEVVDICTEYLDRGDNSVSRAEFEENLEDKRTNTAFQSDVDPLLAPRIEWDFETAMDSVLSNYIAELPGEPWQGDSTE